MNRPALTQTLGLLLALSWLPVALASGPGEPLDQLLACRHIAAGAARLACFDRTSAAVARARASWSVPAQSSRQAATPAMQEALDPQRTFGLPRGTVVQREAAAAGIHVKDAANMTARIVRLGQERDGRAIFTLDNGQIWEQLAADGTDLYTKPGDSVLISRGWLNSFWLEAPSHHGCRVTRLR